MDCITVQWQNQATSRQNSFLGISSREKQFDTVCYCPDFFLGPSWANAVQLLQTALVVRGKRLHCVCNDKLMNRDCRKTHSHPQGQQKAGIRLAAHIRMQEKYRSNIKASSADLIGFFIPEWHNLILRGDKNTKKKICSTVDVNCVFSCLFTEFVLGTEKRTCRQVCLEI